MLPRTRLAASSRIFECEAYLDDAGGPSGHEAVAKDSMHHGADWEFLWVCPHGPAGNENDNAGKNIAAWSTPPASAKPDSKQTSAPPNNAHRSMLQVILDPGVAPAMLGEGIDATPHGDDDGIEEFLRLAGAAQPRLAHEEQDGHDNAVANKGRAHDKVGETLAKMVAATVSHGRDATEQHLHPRDNGHHLAQYGVHDDNEPPS